MHYYLHNYIHNVLGMDIDEDSRQSDSQVDELLNLLSIQAYYILAPINYYGVPRYISRAITRRIIGFVLRHAAYTPGIIEEKTNRLVNRLFREDPVVVYVLLGMGVPYNVIVYFVQSVIYFTLLNIVTIPTPPELIDQ